MNKSKGFSKMWFLAVLLLAFLAGCAENGGDPATLVSVSVTPANFSMPITGIKQFTAIATYGDGSARDVTANPNTTWSSGTPGIASVSPTGLATGVTSGTTPITAAFGGKTSLPVTLTVSNATLVSIVVTPASATIPVLATQQFTAIATYSFGPPLDVTAAPTTAWASGTPGFATVSPTGLATGVAPGISNITASFGGMTSSPAALTVNTATLVSIAVTPSSASKPVGGTQQFTAIATYSVGLPLDVTANPATAWTSDAPAVATVSSILQSKGLATGVAPGTSNITAVFGGKTSQPAVLTVTAVVPPPVPLAINLGKAATFGIASRAGLTSTGVTVINGDVALSPLAVCTDATGNAGAGQACLSKTYSSPTGMTVNGSIYWAGDPFDSGVTASAVTTDLNLAWVEGKAKVPTRPTVAGDQLSSAIPYLPGVYHNATLGLAAGGVATLDAQNDANAIFIFQVDSSFVDSGTLLLPSRIVLLNGAKPRNVWFVTGLDITIGSGTTWNGNILAGRTAVINNGSTVIGRVLAGASGAGAFTLTGAASPSRTTISVPQ